MKETHQEETESKPSRNTPFLQTNPTTSEHIIHTYKKFLQRVEDSRSSRRVRLGVLLSTCNINISILLIATGERTYSKPQQSRIGSP
jgi:hypothetical protein